MSQNGRGPQGSAFFLAMDPAVMANRFQAPEPYSEDEEEDETPIRDLAAEMAALHAMLPLIPPREQDILLLYFVERKKQADIAKIFGVTQAAVSYRLDRAIKRIRFVAEMPIVLEEDMRRDLSATTLQQIDVNILVSIWKSTCQSATAEELGLTQGRVRHRLFKAAKVLKDLAEKNPTYVPYSKIFGMLTQGKKFNILRQINLPQWVSRVTPNDISRHRK